MLSKNILTHLPSLWFADMLQAVSHIQTHIELKEGKLLQLQHMNLSWKCFTNLENPEIVYRECSICVIRMHPEPLTGSSAPKHHIISLTKLILSSSFHAPWKQQHVCKQVAPNLTEQMCCILGFCWIELNLWSIIKREPHEVWKPKALHIPYKENWFYNSLKHPFVFQNLKTP